MTIESLDSTDAEHIEQLVRSRGWALIEERMLLVIEDKRTELEQDMDTGKTDRVRGFIRGVRRCLEIPRELISEGRQGG